MVNIDSHINIQEIKRKENKHNQTNMNTNSLQIYISFIYMNCTEIIFKIEIKFPNRMNFYQWRLF